MIQLEILEKISRMSRYRTKDEYMHPQTDSHSERSQSVCIGFQRQSE